MAELRRGCELCDAEAYVYCPFDGAFLCGVCDEKVHRANFLVARHVRVRVCSHCQVYAGESVSNVNMTACRLCFSGREEEEDCLSSSSSSCVSSTGEEAEVGMTSSSSAMSRRKRVDRRSRNSTIAVDTKVEGILVNWCRSMGIENIMVAQTAVELLSECCGKITILPLRVSLAAAFWASIKLYGFISDPRATATCHVIKRLEQISGVPAKLIISTEIRMAARVLKRSQPRDDHEEGWAEC